MGSIMKLKWTMGLAAIASLGFSGLVAADDNAPADAVTYNKQIVRILQENCQNCHRPNQMAPMSLLTYEESRPWAKAIKKAVADRMMPPWHADPAIGKFENDISLTEQEIADVVRWVDSGAPEGDAADLPAPKTFTDGEWLAGTPDLALKPNAPFMVPPTKPNEDIFHCFVYPTGLTEDRWLQGIEAMAGEPRVVHHLLVFIDNVGGAARLDAATPEPGYPCDMDGVGVPYDGLAAGHAPGTPPTIFEEGSGRIVKAGASIVMQLHYFNRSEETLPDASSAGLHFARVPVKHSLRITPVSAFRLNIPAGDPYAENVARWKPGRDILIGGIMPHMHFIGKDMTINIDYADGSTETILSVPRFDFNWQIAYDFAQPKLVPKGATVRVVGHHDNSAENPRNPSNPPVDVTFGESTGQEMMIGWVAYVHPEEDHTKDPRMPQVKVGETPATGGN